MRRVAQFVGHVTARVHPDEEAFARELLTPAAFRLFHGMPVADRRHALNVARRLEGAGQRDADLLRAALLHDVAKGNRMRLWHRVAGVLLAAAAPQLLRRLASAERRSAGYPFFLYLHHADLSAVAALAAGCTERCARFIRGDARPQDAHLAGLLHDADEAS